MKKSISLIKFLIRFHVFLFCFDEEIKKNLTISHLFFPTWLKIKIIFIEVSSFFCDQNMASQKLSLSSFFYDFSLFSLNT